MRDRFTVYRMYDEAGDLLYVGVTSHLLRRVGDHDRLKSWWADVRRIECEHVGGRDEAERREASLIAALTPRHNRAGIRPAGCQRVAQVARTLRVSSATVRRLIATGDMAAHPSPAGGVFVAGSELAAYIDRNTNLATNQRKPR